jgi:hypothetical protein
MIPTSLIGNVQEQDYASVRDSSTWDRLDGVSLKLQRDLNEAMKPDAAAVSNLWSAVREGYVIKPIIRDGVTSFVVSEKKDGQEIRVLYPDHQLYGQAAFVAEICSLISFGVPEDDGISSPERFLEDVKSLLAKYDPWLAPWTYNEV